MSKNYYLILECVIDMALSEEFKNIAQEGISEFLEDFRARSNELMYAESGILSEHPQDYNFGHTLGYLEGVISTQFTSMHQKSMTHEENFELRRMLAVIAPEIKQLIFDAGHR